MTLLEVTHSTVYNYAEPVGFGPHRILARPRDSMDQRLEDFRLEITPEPARIHWIHDVFGNGIAIAEFEERSERLEIVANMVLDHSPAAAPDFQIEDEARLHPFAYPELYAADLAPTMMRQFPEEREVDDWARRFLAASGETETGHLLMTMTQAIRESFRYIARYEPGTQRPSETLTRGAGTCRDFAQLMIEAVRSLGFAARFVTGYLYSPLRELRNRGGGATHAWCQVYLPGAGWVEFDPTNAIIGTRDLIRVGVAREPGQAKPVAGTFMGPRSAYLGMDVSVSVSRVLSPQDALD
jgi:transglutaminase-like putative cysteine protease